MISGGIDKVEFEYIVDKYKIELADGSFEAFLSHVCFCIKNDIPSDMEVLEFINRFSSKELMDMFVGHLSTYYQEKNAHVLGSSRGAD